MLSARVPWARRSRSSSAANSAFVMGRHSTPLRRGDRGACDSARGPYFLVEGGTVIAPVQIRAADVTAFTVPTDGPESDGTLTWDRTTMVLVEVAAGDQRGLGYSYADRASASLVRDVLAPVVIGHDAMDVAGGWGNQVAPVPNPGRPGAAGVATTAPP